MRRLLEPIAPEQHCVGTAIAIGIGVSAAAGVAGAVISSNASKGAAQTQAGSAQAALNQTQANYNTQTQQFAPYLAAGQAATANLSGLASRGPQWNTPFTGIAGGQQQGAATLAGMQTMPAPAQMPPSPQAVAAANYNAQNNAAQAASQGNLGAGNNAGAGGLMPAQGGQVSQSAPTTPQSLAAIQGAMAMANQGGPPSPMPQGNAPGMPQAGMPAAQSLPQSPPQGQLAALGAPAAPASADGLVSIQLPTGTVQRVSLQAAQQAARQGARILPR